MLIFILYQVIRSRVQHDENAAPVNAKSLHHRHKSMIALPSESKIPVDHRQGLRRTAFGQLNTNAANLQRSRDDSSIKLLAGKQDAPLATQLRDFKPLLERPAHRPFSVAGLKSLLSSGSSKPILQDSASHPGVITNDTQKPLPYTANEAIRAASMSDPSDRIDFQIHEDEAIDKSGPLVPSMTRRPLQNALPTSLILDSGDSWLVSITQSIKACEESSSASDLPPLPPAHAIQPTGSRDEPILIDSQLSVHSSCVAPTISDPEDQISTSSGPLTEQPIDRPSSPVFLQEILEEDEPVSESKATALVVAAPAQKPVDEEVLRAVQRRADCPSPPASVNDGENDNVERHAWAPHDFPDGTLRPIFNDRVFAELEAACDAMDEVERSQEDEDEDWDITLVSEYSDDIFAYMRTLEVSGA